MNKLNTIAKKLDTFIKVISLILIIGLAVSIPIFILNILILKFDPNCSILTDFIELGNFKFTLSPQNAPSTNAAMLYFTLDFAFLFLSGILCYIFLRVIRNILKPIILEQPFHLTTSVNMKKLGWIYIIFGIVVNIFTIAESLILYYSYNWDKIPTNDFFTKITPQFTFDLDFIFVSAFIFLLSYIFKYGAELQQQVDETL